MNNLDGGTGLAAIPGSGLLLRGDAWIGHTVRGRRQLLIVIVAWLARHDCTPPQPTRSAPITLVNPRDQHPTPSQGYEEYLVMVIFMRCTVILAQLACTASLPACTLSVIPSECTALSTSPVPHSTSLHPQYQPVQIQYHTLRILTLVPACYFSTSLYPSLLHPQNTALCTSLYPQARPLPSVPVSAP